MIKLGYFINVFKFVLLIWTLLSMFSIGGWCLCDPVYLWGD